jgi:hypothetical protein
MEKEDLKQKAEEFLNNKDLPQKIESFPSLIAQKVRLITELEKKVEKAKADAKKAKDNAESLKGFEEKSTLWNKFKWKSGKTKEILENTQTVTKDLAIATEQNAEALDLAIEFEKELASTAEFLFYLGCYNIATNEAMIADLNEQLSKDNVEIEEKSIKLSAKVKEQFINVVKRLQAQQDVLYRQEKLSKKSKKHGEAIAKNINQINEHESRLKEKDRIDQEQTSKINEHESRLKEKDRIDQEQTALINEIKKSLNQMDEELSDRIKKLIQTLEDKNALDKEQTSQIEEVRENFKLVYSQYGKLKKIVTIGFIVSYLSLLCIIGWLLFYS